MTLPWWAWVTFAVLLLLTARALNMTDEIIDRKRGLDAARKRARRRGWRCFWTWPWGHHWVAGTGSRCEACDARRWRSWRPEP